LTVGGRRASLPHRGARDYPTGLTAQATGSHSRVTLGCLAVRSGGIGRVLVYHPLFFRERLGSKAVRKCGDYPPAFVALSYLKSGPVMGDNVSAHGWYPSTLTGLPGYDPIRWIKPVQHPLGLHDPRIRF